MTWRAVFNNTTGKLLSIGTVWADVLPPELSYIEGVEPMPDLQAFIWNEATRAFEPRPPKVLVDRLTDVLTDPRFLDWQSVYNALNATRKAQLQAALARLLGSQRYRSFGEDTIL